jgi:hypothetical protein
MLADIMNALSRHVELEEYLRARALGGDHEGILQLVAKRTQFGFINAGLRSGATCAEMLEIRGTRRSVTILNAYCQARRSGACHQDVLDALEVGLKMSHYAVGRECGATHEETLEASLVLDAMDDYATLRKDGVGHEQLMEAARALIGMYGYRMGIQRGIPHEEMMGIAAKSSSRGKPVSVLRYAELYGNEPV